MSSSVILAPSNTAQLENPRYTGVIIARIAAFLVDEDSLLSSAQVCKTWHQHLKTFAAQARENEYCQRIGYPSELVQAFRARRLSLWRLPELQLGKENSDYIEVRDDEVTSPLMRFRDQRGRVGLAMCVRGNTDGSIEFRRNREQIRKITDVGVIFKRYRSQDLWVKKGFCFAGVIYDEVHRPQHQANALTMCPSCPPFEKTQYITWAVALIAQTDAIMKIDGEIEQAPSPAPLPPMPPKPVVAPSAAENSQPPSFPRRIWNIVSGFFAWIASAIASLFSCITSCCRRQ